MMFGIYRYLKNNAEGYQGQWLGMYMKQDSLVLLISEAE